MRKKKLHRVTFFIKFEYNALSKKYNDKCYLIDEKVDEIIKLKSRLKAFENREIKEANEEIKYLDTDSLNKDNPNSEIVLVDNQHNEIIKSK
jgi:hypothetical protein